MKTRSFLAVAALALIPCFASANTFWVSGGDESPEESIAYAATGTVYVPGTIGSTGVVSPGAAYSTITIGDVNDGVPDIMAMAVAATQGTQKPETIIIGENSPSGKTLWKTELDEAMIYQIHFPSLTTRKQGNADILSITFASPLPLQGPPISGEPTGRRDNGPPPPSVALSIPGVQDPAGVTDVSDLKITFPAAIAPPGSVSPPASVSRITVTTPSIIDDGFAEWMNSLIQKGSDVRQTTLNYTFADGSSFAIVLDLQISSLSFSTAGDKAAELEGNLDQTGGTFNPGD